MTSLDTPAQAAQLTASSSSAAAAPPPRPPPRKRNRQALSCTACRERKIKCDRTVPCSQCIKRGDQDHCHIEQKPKIDHKANRARQQQDEARAAHAAATGSHPHPASSSSAPAIDTHAQAPPSPGTMAYNQFSAALSSSGSAFSSTSPPPAEVDAIKARLALLESVLGNMSPPSMSNLTLAALQPSSSTSPAHSSSQQGYHSAAASSTAWMPRSSAGSSPADAFNAGPGSNSTRSTSRGAHSSQSPDSQQRAESDSEEEPDWMSLPRSDANGSTSAFPHQNTNPASKFYEPLDQTNAHRASRKDIDSDTEEAVTVLETLAMSNGQQSRPGQCPTADRAAAPVRSQPDCEEIRVGFERCLLRDKKFDLMSEDADAKPSTCPGTSAAATGSASAPATLATGNPQDALAAAALGSAGLAGLPSGGLDPTAVSASSSTLAGQLTPAAAAAAGIGAPPCACGPGGEGSKRPHAEHGSHNALTSCGGMMPKSELLKKACMAACKRPSLLQPKNGPETLLGWGIGWAFAAGNSRLQDDMDRAKQEGRPFVVTERTEREAVLRAIIEALPSKEIVNQLVEVYESRVRYLCGHIVHIPCLRREIEAFYALESVEKQARVVNHVDAGWLAMLLSILSLGLRFYPCQPKEGWVPVNHLFDGGQTVALWHSASKSCLTLAGYLHSTSISVLQSILLNMLLIGGTWNGSAANEIDQIAASASLIRTAISNAQEMGLHRLGDLDKRGTPQDPPSKVIRREIAKRVWWALVMKDWMSAASGCRKDYVIDRDRFNTPMPGNYNDEDLLVSPLPPSRPREEFTEMSFVLANLEFGLAMKEDFDVRNRREMLAATTGGDRRLTCVEARSLDQRYRAVLENAPSFFRIGSNITLEGRVTCIEVQRWLLQQGVFSKLLRIHRPTLSSRPESRTNCVLLARSILDMQKKIRSRCTVIDRLWINLMQSFSAAIVLALHLLHSRPQADHRLEVRSEILEAVAALKQIEGNSGANVKCIRVIEALLTEEEERWQAGNSVLAGSNGRSGAAAVSQASVKRKWQNDARSGQVDENSGNGSGRRKNLLSLAQKVAAATMGGGIATPRPDDFAQPDQTSSKRAATQAAVNANSSSAAADFFAAPAAFAPTLGDAAASTATFNGMQATLPNPGPSPLPALTSSSGNSNGAGSVAADSSFEFNFPTLPYGASLPQPVYDYSNAGSLQGNAAGAGNAGSAANATRHIAAPNGVDFSLNNPNTPPDGQAFDLAAFLQQCENSPGSSSEGSGPAHEQRSYSQASDTSGFDNQSRSASFDGISPSFGGSGAGANESSATSVSGAGSEGGPSSASPATSAPLAPANNMDSFWNWVLAQGASGQTRADVPSVATAGGVGGNDASGNGLDAFAQAQQAQALQQQASNGESLQTVLAPASSGATTTTTTATSSSSSSGPAFSASTGLTPFTIEDLPFGGGGDEPSVFSTDATSSSAPATTSAPQGTGTGTGIGTTSTSVPYPLPLFQAGTPSSNLDAGTKSSGTTAPSPSPFSGLMGGGGTPSADVGGLENLLLIGGGGGGGGGGGPPLYDFTDYALAWTASNPSALANTASGLGPISDP